MTHICPLKFDRLPVGGYHSIQKQHALICLSICIAGSAAALPESGAWHRVLIPEFIQDITFIPTEQIPQNEADKTSLFDVACELDTGEHVDVEVQVINHKNMRQRALMYCAEMYVNGLPAGEDYRNAHHALTINILAFRLLPQKSPHAVYSMNNLESGDVLDKGMEVHFLEIPKFLRAGKKAIMDLTKMERWLAYS